MVACPSAMACFTRLYCSMLSMEDSPIVPDGALGARLPRR
jgi:hypothetical protein